jgi:hypothetical protein
MHSRDASGYRGRGAMPGAAVRWGLPLVDVADLRAWL